MIISKKNLKIVIAVSGILLLINLCKMFLFAKGIFIGLLEAADHVSIIGGADGPTSIFLAGKFGSNLIPQFLFTCIYFLFEFVVYLFVIIKSIKAVTKNKDVTNNTIGE